MLSHPLRLTPLAFCELSCDQIWEARRGMSNSAPVPHRVFSHHKKSISTASWNKFTATFTRLRAKSPPMLAFVGESVWHRYHGLCKDLLP